jgi:hypothetical protein
VAEGDVMKLFQLFFALPTILQPCFSRVCKATCEAVSIGVIERSYTIWTLTRDVEQVRGLDILISKINTHSAF